ncbi:MAG: hypothetical protein ABF760_05545 [Zymomonas mobilis]|uniref:Uncharacterized protein n=1 Tax=Zymomonas mobilis TaxID=542 RepID=A0A542W3E1_ZYMMB|nr:hypothetical protein [Zymomonas mobilis]TQL18075.1 hypothetical protein FBY58_1690 [Zymomonas mobilis]
MPIFPRLLSNMPVMAMLTVLPALTTPCSASGRMPLLSKIIFDPAFSTENESPLKTATDKKQAASFSFIAAQKGALTSPTASDSQIEKPIENSRKDKSNSQSTPPSDANSSATAATNSVQNASLAKESVASTSSTTALSPQALQEKIAQATDLNRQNKCADSLTILDPILPSLKGHDRVSVQLLRIPCLASLGYDSKIISTYEDIVSIEPDNGAVISVGILIALSQDNFPKAAERLLLLTDKDPARIARFDRDMVQAILSQAQKQKDPTVWQELVLGLSRSSWGIAEGPDTRDPLIQQAVTVYLEKHQNEDAADLLREIADPERLMEMAISRRYEVIWPEIERRLGTHSQDSLRQFAGLWLNAYANQPDNAVFINQSIRAFILAGHLQEAVQLGDSVKITPHISDNNIKAIVRSADARFALGGGGAISGAIGRLQPLSRLDPTRRQTILPVDIRLSEWLGQSGRYYESRNLSEKMLSNLSLSLTPTDIAWFQRSAVCSMMKLGQRGQANQMAEEMRQSHLDNKQAVIEALFCAGKSEEAVNLAISTLDNPSQAESLLKLLQPEGRFPDIRPQYSRAVWSKLSAMPAVERAFLKNGRILPEKFQLRQNAPLPNVIYNSSSSTVS